MGVRGMKRLPIRWRVALLSFSLLIFLLATLGVWISILVENGLLTAQARVLNSLATITEMSLQGPKPTNIQDETTLPVMSKDFASLAIVDGRGAVGKGIGIALLSYDGTTLATDAQAKGGLTVTLDPARVRQWLKTQDLYLLANDDQGQRQLVLLQPIQAWNKPAMEYEKAILQLNMPTTSIDQSVANVRMGLAAGILLALLIAAVLTPPLVGQALRPLIEMERTSRRIADGTLFLRLKEPATEDEVGRLTQSFNSMLARLDKAFTRQKQFVADVSHELRTPLTALGGSLEMLLLEADDGDTEAAQRLMRGMYAEVERMQRLVADLLVLSRLDEGQIKLRMGNVDMGALAREVCEQAEQLAQGQEICCNVTPPLPPLRGDIDHLRRVLLNLVGNALKFTPPTGKIEVSVYAEDKAIIVEVCDTGIGIPEEALPHVFDRFYRVDSSRTRSSLQGGGSGLGLSIAQELVRAHGGTISISSAPGKGTRVTIRLGE